MIWTLEPCSVCGCRCSSVDLRPEIGFFVPGKTKSTLNQRLHHFAKAKQAAVQRNGARLAALNAKEKFKAEFAGRGFVVLLTRVATRDLDSDNLAGALKSIRDGVADVFFDGEDREAGGLSWVYRQERSLYAKGDAAGVRVQIFKKLDSNANAVG